jgi:protein gp37
MAFAARLKAMGNPRYRNDGDPRTSGPGFGLTLHWDVLEQPLRWRRPSMVFVDSMSDLFHARVPFEFVERLWKVMLRTEDRHIYLVLTKRADRMSRFSTQLPLCRNVWLGVSVEDQAACDRIRWLDQTWAAQRFISAEPLLGPLDLAPFLGERISWVIVGGESGAQARPCNLDWLRQLRDQCTAAGAALFVKQLGTRWARDHALRGKGREHGQCIDDFPADLRIREWPR